MSTMNYEAILDDWKTRRGANPKYRDEFQDRAYEPLYKALSRRPSSLQELVRRHENLRSIALTGSPRFRRVLKTSE